MMITELGSIGEIVIRYMTYLVFHWHKALATHRLTSGACTRSEVGAA